MDMVHVFTATGRFNSFEQMRSFIDQTYTEDGDGIPSAFMEEIGLRCYEPMCIEAYHSECIQGLRHLLNGSSYGEQWLSQVDVNEIADSAICVFPPNTVSHPNNSSLKYIGGFTFVSPSAQQAVSADRPKTGSG